MDTRGSNDGYGNQQQPRYAPPSATPKTIKKALIGIGIGGLLAVVAIGSTGKSTSTGTPTAAAGTITQAQSQPTAAVVVYTTTGNGLKDTGSFIVGNDWTIRYSFDCANYGMQGNFQIEVDKNITKFEANALAKSGSDSSVVHGDPGKHYLSIISECDWTITVTDGG